MSDLDKDFETFVGQINVKLNEAASALREANELREKAGLPALIFSAWLREEAWREFRDLEDEDENFDIDARMDEERAKYEKIDTDALERELSHAGWSTSSSYC